MNAYNRPRPASSIGSVKLLHGEFKLAAPSGALTTVAAGTTTAGHVFVMRNPDTAKLVLLRYLAIDFTLTTAFGAAQNMGFDAIVARSFTASYTGGTAIDMGSTLTNSGKVRKNQSTSLFTANTCRIATTSGLTAGTQTLDANPFVQVQKWMGAVGAQISETLFDARDDGGSTRRSPIELAQDEGIVIRNTILMGATGVGTLLVRAEWDEVTL